MEYKDIKTADELESWYAEKQAVLDSHARDYMVPFGFVYHLDCSGYVSFERWNDTLPTAEEQTASRSSHTFSQTDMEPRRTITAAAT